MKNKWFLGFSVLLVFGLFFMACPTDGGSDDDPFAGTWTSSHIKIVAANGSINQYLISNNKEVIRGTYTYSGNTVTAKITDVNTAMFQGEDIWVTFANLSEVFKGYIGGETQQITINGNTFTANEEDFTKQ